MAAISIADQLKVLVELQALDAQIYELKRQKENKPVEAASIKAKQQEFTKEVHALEARYKAFEVKKKELEIELEQKEGQIRKLQSQLFQCKTNKEYSAMQREIEGVKADKSIIEEDVIKMMDEADQLKARQQSERDILKVKEAELQKELAKIDEQVKTFQKQIDEFQAGRLGLLPKVDPKILARYEKILEKTKGLALVPVVKEGACGGCNIVLPPQMVNEIMAGTKMIPCESCARLLYIESTA